MLKALADFVPTWPVWLAVVGLVVFGIIFVLIAFYQAKRETEREEEHKNRESQFRQEIMEREQKQQQYDLEREGRWHRQQLEILAMIFDRLGVEHAKETTITEPKTNKQDKTSQT